MHPAVVVVIVLGGVFVSWGAYEAIHTLYEWHNDRKEQREYEEYVRVHAEKSRGSDDIYQSEEEDDDDKPLGFWKQRRDSLNHSRSELRRRHTNPFSDMEQISSNYELCEMERSISNRRGLLAREREILLKEEAELERQRQLLRSRGNSIIGVVDDQEESDPFTDSFMINDQQVESKISNENSSVVSAKYANEISSIVSANNINVISRALSDKSDLESWSDVDHGQVRQRSDSSESFESIHHHQL